ncbi:MAG: recombinase family protein, partial [Oscillospiraceae bacterium]|nr:recombinase family protein [Oscillospiraceae bacterium]
MIPAKQITPENQHLYHQLRVAAYCRVSTELEEQQNSYEVQIAYYTNLIQQKKEWTLVGIFADKGISGTSAEKRKEFKRMIRMCEQRKIDLILCKSASRFARNTEDSIHYIRKLKSLGIGVIFEKENLNTLAENSELMLTLYGTFAQAESESISKNVTLGIQMGYRQGKVRYRYKHWLGYRKGADGQPEIIPEDAETVKLIFKLFLDGYSVKDIALQMIQKKRRNAVGIPEWNSNTIRRILSNEKYVGDALLQKTYTIDCLSHKSVKNNGERPMYLVSDCHPAIIDRETFQLAQQEMARRNSKRKISDRTITERGKYSSKYALTELMLCGECGTPYRRVTWNVHGKKRIVWRCISRLDHGNRYCKNSPSIHEEPLHRAIVNAINTYYDCQEDIKKILKKNVDIVLHQTEHDEISAIEKRLSEIDKARTDMIGLIVGGTFGEDALDAEFRKLFDEEQQLCAKLTTLKAQNQNLKNTENDMVELEEKIDTAEFSMKEFDNVLVRKLLECVRVVDQNHIQVIFKGGYEICAVLE